MFTGILLYRLARFLTDVGIVFQGSRYGRGRHIQRTGDVLDGDLGFIHGIFKFQPKVRILPHLPNAMQQIPLNRLQK